MSYPSLPVARFAMIALLASVALADPAAAQTVVGRVLEQGTSNPVGGVHVQLLDTDEQVVASGESDDDGRFRIAAPGPGTWHVATQLIGYADARSEPFDLWVDEVIRIEIQMPVDPVAITEPIVVVGERSHTNPSISEFHDRRRRGELTGVGHFIYGEDLERAGGRPSDLFRMVPGVSLSRARGVPGQVVRMRGGCIPAIYIDGHVINEYLRGESLDTYVDVSSIEGIEIYRGTHQPASPYFDRTGCGTVLIWTKRGDPNEGEPFTWTRLGMLLGIMASLFLLHAAL